MQFVCLFPAQMVREHFIPSMDAGHLLPNYLNSSFSLLAFQMLTDESSVMLSGIFVNKKVT